MFRKYDKVQRLEKDECKGILNGICYIFEKIDGANASVWYEDDYIHIASRNREIAKFNPLNGDYLIMDSFRGLANYVFENDALKMFLLVNPHLKLYGEWLVKHTINYPEDAYEQLYIFDVFDSLANRFLRFEEYERLFLKLYWDWPNIARPVDAYTNPGDQSLNRLISSLKEEFGIKYLDPLIILKNPSLEEVKEFVGKTQFDIPYGEGIVVKNYDFINEYGYNIYGKLVTKDFLEMKKNNILFKSKDAPTEVKIAQEYVTEARVNKIIEKMKDKNGFNNNMSDIPAVMGMVWHDVITEDMWDILKRYKNPVINFKDLKKNCDALSKQFFVNQIMEVT